MCVDGRVFVVVVCSMLLHGGVLLFYVLLLYAQTCLYHPHTLTHTLLNTHIHTLQHTHLRKEERGHRVKRAVWIMSNDQRPQGKEIELQGPEEDAAYVWGGIQCGLCLCVCIWVVYM